MDLPAHYSIDSVCAACQGAIKSGDGRYRIGESQYHTHCFDISIFGLFLGRRKANRATE